MIKYLTMALLAMVLMFTPITASAYTDSECWTWLKMQMENEMLQHVSKQPMPWIERINDVEMV